MQFPAAFKIRCVFASSSFWLNDFQWDCNSFDTVTVVCRHSFPHRISNYLKPLVTKYLLLFLKFTNTYSSYAIISRLGLWKVIININIKLTGIINFWIYHMFVLLIFMILPEKYNEKLRFMFHSFLFYIFKKKTLMAFFCNVSKKI